VIVFIFFFNYQIYLFNELLYITMNSIILGDPGRLTGGGETEGEGGGGRTLQTPVPKIKINNEHKGKENA
jgi:hypothetical protein